MMRLKMLQTKWGDYYGNNGFYEDLVDAINYYKLM